MGIIAEIKKDIADKRASLSEFYELTQLLSDRFLTDTQKLVITQEIKKLQQQLGIKDDFQYSVSEITVARPTEMLIPMLIPRAGIIPVIGHYGAGKTTLARHLYKLLLATRDDTFIRYVDADNPINKLQEFGVHELIEMYGDRFEYYGKRTNIEDLADGLEHVMRKSINEQNTFPNRSYIVFEDNLKNLMRKNRQGFADLNHLYRLEKEFQSVGGTSIILHHTNKQGIFADSKDIVNFADLAYYVTFKESTNAIVLEPDKQSRYHVESKAFYVDPDSREISHEIDYRMANISIEEIKIVQHIKELLKECGEFNQQELEKETRIFRNNIGMGDKRFRAILKKYDCEAWKIVRGINNAMVFEPIELPNVPNLPNDDERDNQAAKPIEIMNTDEESLGGNR
jgi:energy-coupling factor transporter ATP-binding protein EcfA2